MLSRPQVKSWPEGREIDGHHFVVGHVLHDQHDLLSLENLGDVSQGNDLPALCVKPNCGQGAPARGNVQAGQNTLVLAQNAHTGASCKVPEAHEGSVVLLGNGRSHRC